MSKSKISKENQRFERLLAAVSEKLEVVADVDSEAFDDERSEVSSLSEDFFHLLRQQCSEPHRGKIRSYGGRTPRPNRRELSSSSSPYVRERDTFSPQTSPKRTSSHKRK